MRVAVIGSRGLNETALMPKILKELPAETTEIVSGGAEGADKAAEAVAMAVGIPVRVFRPDYDTFGKQAPLIRNRQIVDYAELVLAFWDGASRGTAAAIGICIENEKPIRVIPI